MSPLRFLNHITSLGGKADKEVTNLNRFTLIGGCAFLTELILIYLFTEHLHFNFFPAITLSFCVGLSIHYSLSRRWIFHESLRSHFHGYTYFALIAGGGLLIALAVSSYLINTYHMNPVAARMISAVGSGLWNYILNSRFNFRV